jgi:flagellar biosynthesis/type III secretory pathway protein FliH
METVPELEKAFRIANQANLSLEEFQNMEAQEMALEEERGVITRGIRDGLELAKIQLMQEGIEAGRQEGIETGIKAGQTALILRLLERRIGTVNPDVVSRIGELSIEQLESLVEDLARFSSLSDLMIWLDRAE